MPHHHAHDHNHEAHKEQPQAASKADQVRAMKIAFGVNLLLALSSLASGTFGDSDSAKAEGQHDLSDAGTHGLDLLGERSKSRRFSRLARKIAGVAILGSAAGVAIKSGIDLTQPQAAPDKIALANAWIAAPANIALHRYMDRVHHRSEGYGANFAASHNHTKWDSVISPLLTAGVTIAQFPGLEIADEIAAGIGGAATFGGNLKPALAAFRPDVDANTA